MRTRLTRGFKNPRPVSRRNWKRILSALLLLALLIIPHSVHADIAPPAQPPGSNLEPGSDITQVRMMAETVLIDVRADAPQESLGQARVTADFTMRNLGSQAERMAARFPISASDGWGNFPEIKDFRVSVNGNAVSTRRIVGEDPYGFSDQVPWAEFDVTFPPAQDVHIRVTYTLEGTGEYPFISFNYILSTGAGWKDTIGSVDLIVRLPYEADIYNFIIGEEIGWGTTMPGALMVGKEIRWHYDNLEPAPENNLVIVLVMPSAWKKVLTEQANIARSPNDGEAWGRLGKIYKEIAFLRRGMRHDAGGLELYALSLQAYEKAVTLLPNDALWHAGFAELLWRHYYWEQYWTDPSINAEMLRALGELNLSLEIDPTNYKALEVLAEITGTFPDAVRKEGDRYVFLYLTATPAPPIAIATMTPQPSPAVVASPTEPLILTPQSAAPSPTEPSSGPSLPICGSAILVPFAAVLVAKLRW